MPNLLPERGPKPGERAGARIVPLVIVCLLLLGLGAAAWWYHSAHRQSRQAVQPTGGELAEGTIAVLSALDAPVAIRFYGYLDPGSTTDSLRAFASRVDELLARYERIASDKVTVARYSKPSDVGAASAAGIRPFNIEKGAACFLGVTITANDRMEVLTQLSPDWEAALESDLSRAIARVSAPKSAGSAPAPHAPPPDPAVIAEVKRAIPNLESVSLAEGKQILRSATLEEIKAMTGELQPRLNEARERLNQTSSSETGRQAAMKLAQQLEAEQTEKLKEIAARGEARIQVLEQIKSR